MDIDYVPFEFPHIAGVRSAFQTRACNKSFEHCDALAGGNISYVRGDCPERVLAYRLALQKELGFLQVAEAKQVHGDRLLFDARASSQRPDQALLEADGLATDERGLALLIKTADCQPVLFAHNSGKHLMALHVGWRGNKMAYIQKAVKEWCEVKALKPCDLSAVRGPSLGPKKAEFINFADEWGAEFLPYFDKESRCMDLWALSRDQLLEAGLLEENIFGIDLCTMTEHERFFSHRISSLAGRQGSFIWAGPLE